MIRKHGRQAKARKVMVERAVALSMFDARTVRVMRNQGACSVFVLPARFVHLVQE